MPAIGIVQVIMPIIIIPLAGFVLGKFKKVNIKTLADYIIYLASPALVLAQLSMQPINLREISLIALAVAFVILGTGAVVYLFFKTIKLQVPAGYYLPIMFMNSGFLGYPLALFAFGADGLSKAIIYDIANALLLFTLGIFIVSQGKDRWQALKLPFIYAALLGFILSLLGIKLPPYLYSPLYLIGGTAIPLALIMLGCRLAELKITSWKLPLLASVLRLGLGLGLGLLAVFIFRLEGLTAKIVILSSALASAVTAAPLAEEYDSGPDLVASTIALSTILCIISVMLVLKLTI
ncbi:MAG: AEC family transporter [Candidatus Margulisbacteria bacterium]|nr:AEC family transporter [Candidatus Margulisiibacteriota bacterium]